MSYHVIIPKEMQKEKQWCPLWIIWPVDRCSSKFTFLMCGWIKESESRHQGVWVWLIIVDSQFWSQLGSVCVRLLSFCCLTLAFHISTCSFISFFHFFVRVSGSNLMLKIKWYSPETGKHNIFNRQIIYKRAIFHSKRSNCHMILTGCGCALSRRPWGQHCQWCSTPCCAASSPSEPFGKLNATNLLNFGFATFLE